MSYGVYPMSHGVYPTATGIKPEVHGYAKEFDLTTEEVIRCEAFQTELNGCGRDYSEAHKKLSFVLNEDPTLSFEAKRAIALMNESREIAKQWCFNYLDGAFLEDFTDYHQLHLEFFSYAMRNPNLNGENLRFLIESVHTKNQMRFLQLLPEKVWTPDNVTVFLKWLKDAEDFTRGYAPSGVKDIEKFLLKKGRQALALEDLPLNWIARILAPTP